VDGVLQLPAAFISHVGRVLAGLTIWGYC
jgi:hypothetical protein